MANKKLTELQPLPNIPANTQQLILVVVDDTGLTPVTKKMPFSMVDAYVGGDGDAAFIKANASFNAANTALNTADAAYAAANLISAGVITSLNLSIATAQTHANSAFDRANVVFNTANNISSNVTIVGTYANAALSVATTSNTYSLQYTTSGAPSTPFGTLGDKKGMVSLDAPNYLYYCVANYDGVNKIWYRANTTNDW